MLRLFRPAINESEWETLNAAWGDLGRLVSDLRDRAVLLDTFDLVFPEPIEDVEVLRMRILADRDAAYAGWLHDTSAIERLVEGFAGQHALWKQADIVLGQAEVGESFNHAFHLASETMTRVLKSPGSPEKFHSWRKRVKDWSYHHELLREVFGETEGYEARMHRLDHLANLLGLAHDAAVFEEYVRENDEISLYGMRQIAFFRMDQEAAALAHGEKLFLSGF